MKFHFDTQTGKLYHARLMSEQATIDSVEFARSGRCLRGDVAVADMARLRESLGSHNEVLHYALTGAMSEKGRPQLVCEVDGVLNLVCQRCMEPFRFPLSTRSVLELASEGEVLPSVEEEDDAVDLIPADAATDVLALIEDEVLLSLPIAPMHDGDACGVAPSFRAGKINPFEVLSTLKKNS
jgi:uncharacterized protein